MIVNLDDRPDAVAVVVTLGVKTARLKNCIESLYNQSSPLRLAILCIVNNTEFNNDILDTAKVTIHIAGLNLGFAGALTFGRQFVNAPLLWIIQDDMVLEKNCLQELFLSFDNKPNLAVVAPMVLTEEGKILKGSCGGILDKFGKTTHCLPEVSTPVNELVDIDLLSYIFSRGMLIKIEAWDAVRGVDPRYYPISWTDVDLCTAFKRKGLTFELAKSAFVWHEKGGSTLPMVGQFAFHRNNQLYISKWLTNAPCRQLAQGNLHSELDKQLVNIVAQHAADAFLQMGQEYNAQEEKNNQITQKMLQEIQLITLRFKKIEQDLKNIHNSFSWRITKPLRVAKKIWNFLMQAQR